MRFYDVSTQAGAKKKIVAIAVVFGLVFAAGAGFFLFRFFGRHPAPAPSAAPQPALTREQRETQKKLEELEQARQAVMEWYASAGQRAGTSTQPQPSAPKTPEEQAKELDALRRQQAGAVKPPTGEEVQRQLQELEKLRSSAL